MYGDENRRVRPALILWDFPTQKPLVFLDFT